MFAAVVEDDARSGREVLDGLGDEHPRPCGEGADTGADGDAEAGDVLSVELARYAVTLAGDVSP